MQSNDFRVYEDDVVAQEKPRYLPPEDSYIAVCCDVVNLGLQKKDNSRYNKPDTMVKQCRVDFLIPHKNPETGQYVRLSEWFTVSLGEKANLRKFMENWRGKAFTPEELEAGIVIDKMVGAHALVQVTVDTSKSTGRKFAKISAIQKVPGAMRAEAQAFPVPANYVRMKDRKQEGAPGTPPAAPPLTDEDLPMDEQEDDLPF
jgi:hypothetical protein